MEHNELIPLTRGARVRFTTDRLSERGVQRGSEGLIIYRDDTGLWRVSTGEGYVDAVETDFEVILGAPPPRGVMIPSLRGGWLTIDPAHGIIRDGKLRVPSRWDAAAHEYTPGDFVGSLSITVPLGSYGLPIVWSRETQLDLVYFFDTPDRMTYVFPQGLHVRTPDGELEIDGSVTIDRERGSYATKAAELQITLRSPLKRRPKEFTAFMLVPAYTCATASRWLVDLFPSVNADDLDYT